MLKHLKLLFPISHFSKSLDTSSLPVVNKQLDSFIKSMVPLKDFDSNYLNFNYYVSTAYRQSKDDSLRQKIYFFDKITKIYTIYKLSSKEMIKIFSRLSRQCLQTTKLSDLVKVMLYISRYNKKKSIAIFKAKKEAIEKQIFRFSPHQIIQLCMFLQSAHINDHLVLESAVQIVFQKISSINQYELGRFLSYLAWSKKFINKVFLIKSAKRFQEFFKSNSLETKYMYNFIANISQIQKNLVTRSIYLSELDEIYASLFSFIANEIKGTTNQQLNKFINAIRRSAYYDQRILYGLAEVAIQRQIIEFAQKPRQNSISLATLLNLFHTLASFNYHSLKFKQYIISILKLMASSKDQIIPLTIASKVVWSLCVLFDHHQIVDVYPFVQHYMKQLNQQTPNFISMNFYYFYLYLKTHHPVVQLMKDKFSHIFQGRYLTTNTSETQREVEKTLIDIGVPCLSEYNVNNLICDIMIPEWENLKNVLIDIHGYQHFCRNQKRQLGSTVLRQKLLSGEHFKYYYISLDEWFIIQDKKKWMQKYLDIIGKKQTQDSKNKKVIKKLGKSGLKIQTQPSKFYID